MKSSYVILLVTMLLLTSKSPSAFACTCVRGNKWMIKKELSIRDIAVEGRIISVTDYRGTDFPWQYKRFRLVVETTFKAPGNIPDTIAIITGRDGSSCGYKFRLGEKYIVYGNSRPQAGADDHSRQAARPVFFTDMCTLTKEVNRKELARLKRLTR